MSGWLKTLLAIAALIVIVIGGFVLLMLGQDMWRSATRGVQTTDMVNIDPANDAIDERLFLSDITRIGDGPLSRATLYVSQEFDAAGGLASYSKSSSDNALNMLFMEPGAAERWLFQTNDQLIYRSTSLSLLPLGANRETQPEAALLLHLVSEDTNRDQRLSEDDIISLALVQPDGRGLVTLVDTVQGNVGMLSDPTALVLTLETATGIEVLRIDPTSFAILDRKPIDFPK